MKSVISNNFTELYSSAVLLALEDIQESESIGRAPGRH